MRNDDHKNFVPIMGCLFHLGRMDRGTKHDFFERSNGYCSCWFQIWLMFKTLEMGQPTTNTGI